MSSLKGPVPAVLLYSPDTIAPYTGTMAVTENVSSCSLSAMWDWSHLSLSGAAPTESLLDAATDLLLLDRNFPGSLELCERGLQIISTEPRGGKNEQVKAALIVIAIQALAEMERWREVLPWLIQYYHSPEDIPHTIMELCLLLHSRVKQPHVMLDLGRTWLRAHASRPSVQYKRVAELHLLNILLPLGHFSEAEDLAQDPRVFSVQQQEVALRAMNEEKQRLERAEEADRERQPPEQTAGPSGDVRAVYLQAFRLLSGALSAALMWIRRVPLRPVLLALLLLAIILLRLDPASPASQGPIWRLLLLLRQLFSG